jgi:hypothetical protein
VLCPDEVVDGSGALERASVSAIALDGRGGRLTVPELREASAATAPVGSRRRCMSGGRCWGTARPDLLPFPSW